MQHNTYKEGRLQLFMYPTPEGSYVAACRELGLLREGKDEEALWYGILGDAKSYLTNVIRNKLGEDLLNQDLPKEILSEYKDYRAKKKNEDFQQAFVSFDKLLKKQFKPQEASILC